MDWQFELISLYLLVCKEYSRYLGAYCQRMSNHVELGISDEEVLTLYLFGLMSQQQKLTDIYEYAQRHLKEWFPTLPSYVTFVRRIDRLQDVFIPFIEQLQTCLPVSVQQEVYQLIDSMPIILAQRGRRFNAKVASEIATKNGYCATKKLHYYGVKLHILADYQKGSLPIPRHIGLTSAGVADLKAYEPLTCELRGCNVFADKAYQTQGKPILEENGVRLHTPVKKKKGEKYLDAADQLLSTAISRIRQPIEALFSWLEAKTKIQMASKVRSYAGLMVHVFGRITAAFLMLQHKFCT
jgi:hypothetical protein